MAESLKKVRLETARAGHRTKTVNGETHVIGVFSQKVGDIVNMPKGEADRYIERGYATEVK